MLSFIRYILKTHTHISDEIILLNCCFLIMFIAKFIVLLCVYMYNLLTTRAPVHLYLIKLRCADDGISQTLLKTGLRADNFIIRNNILGAVSHHRRYLMYSVHHSLKLPRSSISNSSAIFLISFFFAKTAAGEQHHEFLYTLTSELHLVYAAAVNTAQRQHH